MSTEDKPGGEHYSQNGKRFPRQMKSKGQAGSRGQLGREFDVKDPLEDEVEYDNDEAPDGFIADLKPIPHLRDLMDKLFPPRV